MQPNVQTTPCKARPVTDKALKSELIAGLKALAAVIDGAGEAHPREDDYLVRASYCQVSYSRGLVTAPLIHDLRAGTNHQVLASESLERRSIDAMKDIDALVRRAMPHLDRPELATIVELCRTRKGYLRAEMAINERTLVARPAALGTLADIFVQMACDPA